MNRLLRFLGNRWVLTAVAFLAIALIIWLLGPFLAIADHRLLESVPARLVAILLVALVWLIAILIRQLWTRRADRRLLDDLSDSGSGGGAPDPRPAAEVEEEKAILRQRFEEAVEVLRRPGRAGQRRPTSLYELPWYIVIGPPGCGKTTALVNSGIDFPLAERFGTEALSGIGGTRNCDWWISNEAVIIDTAGRYTTQDSDAGVDSAAWTNFLDLLKKYRRRRPINGAVVAFSLPDLVTLDEATLELHGRAVRRRLRELSDRLGISIPVYLILTKADLIAGFVEFFDDLGREERQQVWGTTFPFADPGPRGRQDAAGDETIGHFRSRELPALIERLNARLNWRLISERDLRRRSLILGFPQQVASLGEPIERFLNGVFRGSRFEKPILLRGVYFCSGTQEGTPIDRLMGALADVAGLGRQSVAPTGGRGKSYFITDLLRRVVFLERNLAGADRRAERIQAWIRRGAYAATLVLTLVMALAWTTSFTQNKAFTADIEARLRHYAELDAGDPPSATDFERILPRLDALRELAEQVGNTAQSPPLTMRMGLYQGQGIADSVRDTYVRALNAYLVPGLAANLERQLAQGDEEPSLRYELLKLYLMLAEPARLDPELLSLWASDLWSDRYPGQPRILNRLKSHLEFLVSHDVQAIEPDRRLVKWVRDGLEQYSLAELIYGRLKLSPAARNAQPLRLEDILGRSAEGIFAPPASSAAAEGMPALFTYRGFYQIFQPQALLLVSRIKDETWVYGAEQSDTIAGQVANLEDAVLDRYIDEYIHRWDTLLGQLNIVSFNSLTQAVEVSGRLIRPDSTLRHVLNVVETNTRLTRLPQGTEPFANIAIEVLRRQNYYLSRLIGEAQQGAFDQTTEIAPKRVERHFDLLTRLVDRTAADGLAQIQRLLADLYTQLSALEPASGLTAGPIASTAAGSQNIFQSLRTEAARSPEPLRRWLRQIAANAQTVALGNTGLRINEIWSTSVVPVCKQLVEDRYPFAATAQREINLQDFGNLFGGGGIFDTFFAENLEPFVDTSSNPWRWRANARETLGVSDASLEQLQRARRIREAFFPEGGKRPAVRFSLIPRRLDPGAESFSLSFGGQILSFQTERPAPADGEWPGRTISNSLTLTATLPAPPPAPPPLSSYEFIPTPTPVLPPEPPKPLQVEETRNGQWAFFRLVHRPNLRSGTDRFQVNLPVGRFRQTFELQAYSVINAFALPDLQEFRCPDRL